MPGAPRETRPTVQIRGFVPEAALEASGETRLPGRFSESELESAWTRAGRNLPDLYALQSEARGELRHPFTLRAFLESYDDTVPKSALTRSDILETWLRRRLEAEARPQERVTSEHLRQSLCLVTRLLDATNLGSLSVDDLTEAPRFDPAHPPGPVVQRLIDANILETLPRHADRIRFAVEAVQDFYRGDVDVAAIHEDSSRMAAKLASLRFTDAYPRLVRIGRQLGGQEGPIFLEQLSNMDARHAATVLSVDPIRYPAELRAKVVRAIARDITSNCRVRGAFAISLLGGLRCQESVSTLQQALLPEAPSRHRGLNHIGAEALLKLSAVAAAEFVYCWEWFDDYYFPDRLAICRSADPEFRRALTHHAVAHLASQSGTAEHLRAVAALGYLADPRLVDHLRARLTENGILEEYENHALWALGTEAAAELFGLAVSAVNVRVAGVPDDAAHNDKHARLFSTVEPAKADVPHLVTPAFADQIQKFVQSKDRPVWSLGMRYAREVPIPSLIYDTVVAATKWERGWHDVSPERLRAAVMPTMWLDWWRSGAGAGVRKGLLKVLPLYPTAPIETVLIDCLESTELRGEAAAALGRYASVRAAPFLRQILAEVPTKDGWWARFAVADALGRLRDQEAIPILSAVARSDPHGEVVGAAIMSLGFVGNDAAESALCALLREGVRRQSVVEALLLCGTTSAVAVAVAEAKKEANGWRWISERLGHCSWRRGWRRGEYHTHIDTRVLVEYVDVEFQPGTERENWDVVHWFREIDTPDVRALLKKWANRRGTDQDPPATNGMMSGLCFAELADRGDDAAIPWVLDRAASDDSHYLYRVREELEAFASTATAAEIKRRLLAACDETSTRRMLALLGRFGTAADGEMVRPFLDNPDPEVANIACESLLRLTDPLLVPDRW